MGVKHIISCSACEKNDVLDKRFFDWRQLKMLFSSLCSLVVRWWHADHTQTHRSIHKSSSDPSLIISVWFDHVSSYTLFMVKWINTGWSRTSCRTHEGNHTHRGRSLRLIPRALITVNLAHYVLIDARLPQWAVLRSPYSCSITCMHHKSFIYFSNIIYFSNFVRALPS